MREYVVSSNINWLDYDMETETLNAGFKNGGIYSYCPVTHATYNAILTADSVGGMFNSLVKKAGTPWTKVQ